MERAIGVPWLTTAEAASYLRFRSTGAFHTWLCRQRKAQTLTLKVYRFRRRMRFRQVDLDRLLQPDPPVETRKSAVRRPKGA